MGEDDVETMTNVTLGKYDFDDDVFNTVSDNAKDFIQRLLTKDVRYEKKKFEKTILFYN